ncbi:MAG: hypothetical protein ACR2KT_00555 [Methylocella sp.]
MMQLAVTAAAISFAVWTWREHRNADLVRIGISVLRVDPEKEKQVSEATRKWALDLIDANAGDVKFSPDARAQLLKKPLETYGSGYNVGFDSGSFSPVKPARPARRLNRRSSHRSSSSRAPTTSLAVSHRRACPTTLLVISSG